MLMVRDVRFVRSAEDDLAWYRKTEQQLIYDTTIRLLRHEADVETKKRRRLRSNPLAPWELRLGKYRVFYEVAGDVVRILAVGHKEHDQLFVRGVRVKL
jgi:mRNA-degrading endonuclease RelE of RelBE toxin-antitoxin system